MDQIKKLELQIKGMTNKLENDFEKWKKNGLGDEADDPKTCECPD